MLKIFKAKILVEQNIPHQKQHCLLNRITNETADEITSAEIYIHVVNNVLENFCESTKQLPYSFAFAIVIAMFQGLQFMLTQCSAKHCKQWKIDRIKLQNTKCNSASALQTIEVE
ncbi:hypothetical protein Tsp_07912 [Trichinella spiralis]|uniref:hypothetical protein n=1 Tax=Trichinella spiralis TaxID=6334 RepID=UPI0001EFB484|nr:hypothetical protein Tsp_07912 [Trichinella spiralis]